MQVDLPPGRTRRKTHLHQVDVTQASPGPRGLCDAIECKWQAASYSPRALAAFRALHPEGGNYVITPQVEPAYVRAFRGLLVVFCSLGQWETDEAERTLGLRPPP
jgi:hypothetical protein